MHVAEDELRRLLRVFTSRWTEDAVDIDAYLARQVSDDSHREVIGPLRPASGPSGVLMVAGNEVGAWGDPDVPEMAFSATKSVVRSSRDVPLTTICFTPTSPFTK